MMIENAKMMIHQLANQLTVIMGNLELAMLNIEKSPELLDKARRASREALIELRKLSQLLASIAEDAHQSAMKAAKEATQAALDAGVAVELAAEMRDAANETARKTAEVRNELDKATNEIGKKPK